MWAHLQFFDSAQNFSLWSKYILSCSIMAANFSRPSIIHNLPPPILGMAHQAIIPLECLQVSSQQGCLWRKYHFGESNWYETYTTSLYDQIMNPWKIWAQVATPFECIIQISFLDQIWQLKATMIYLNPIILQVTKMKVLFLNLADNSIGSKTLPVDH